MSMERCIESLEVAYRELGLGNAVNAPRRWSFVPTTTNGVYYRFKTMEGGIKNLGVMAQRVNSDLVLRPLKDQKKIPAATGNRYVGLVFLYSMENLELLAIMTDGQLQRMRVAGVTAVAAKHLSRKDATTLGLFGTGWQAESAVNALNTVRGLKRLRVFSPTLEHRNSFADKIGKNSGMDVTVCHSPREVPVNADIVSSATNSISSSVCRADWIENGAHVSSILGSEFNEGMWRRADKIYYTSTRQETYEYFTSDLAPLASRSKKLQDREGSLVDEHSTKVATLQNLLSGKASGRETDDEITFFYKGTGLGIEFAAPAKVLYNEALRRGVGREISSQWFTQTSHP